MDAVKGRFDAFLEEIKRAQISCLQQLGEMCVAYARSVPPETGFHDQTGNLRSSIGYMVFVDGVAVHSSPFEQVQPKADVSGGVQYNGSKVGEEFCRQIGEQTTGVCLVCVAGMNYAQYVESKGRDVLTGAEHLAEKELPRMLEQLVKNIKARSNENGI